jgi:hypothetical protein
LLGRCSTTWAMVPAHFLLFLSTVWNQINVHWNRNNTGDLQQIILLLWSCVLTCYLTY